jgi:hypothetical protein
MGWGIFCACSWTWCIGMFLPTIMLERYGLPGFLVFAVPNVLGCAAFGYVLTRARSESMVARHGRAMGWFSIATIAYHTCFMPILIASFGLPLTEGISDAGPLAGGVMLSTFVFAGGLVLSAIPTRLWPWLAVGVYAFSIAAFVRWGGDALGHVAMSGTDPVSSLLWLAPIITVGFILCPYLDLTFHRARQQAGTPHAFAVFGVTFAVMIVFTVAYAGAQALTTIVLWHILIQSMFTIGAHLRELRLVAPRPRGNLSVSMAYLPLFAAFLYPAVRLLDVAWTGGAEDVYLRYLVLYGLVLPLYALVFIGPLRPVTWSRRAGWGYAAVVVAMMPFYEAAFIHGRAWALIVPLVVLVAWIARRSRSLSPSLSLSSSGSHEPPPGQTTT